jgi:hypothetical protein
VTLVGGQVEGVPLFATSHTGKAVSSALVARLAPGAVQIRLGGGESSPGQGLNVLGGEMTEDNSGAQLRRRIDGGEGAELVLLLQGVY